MTKKIRKGHANNHLANMKLGFLAAMVSGVDKHLTTPAGNVVFSRLNNAKRNDQFRNHMLKEFAKRSTSALDNIQHETVAGAAEKFQNRYLKAAERNVTKVAKQGENFNHEALLEQTFTSFDKLHAQLLNKL